MRVALALVATLTVTGCAGSAQDQLRAQVGSRLDRNGFRQVDVDRLSTGQLAALHGHMNSQRSEGDKRALIRSTLGGRNSLRGLLIN